MNKKKQLKIKYPIKNNFMPKLSLWLIVIVAIILFDKFVDVMGLNKDYLICIFMNINEMTKIKIYKGKIYCHLKGLGWISIGCTLHP